MKYVFLLFYYGILKHFPATDNNLPIRNFVRKMRSWCAGKLFDAHGKNINV